MMSPAMEGKECSRKRSPAEYDSPNRDRHSTRGRNSRRRDMSPAPAPAPAPAHRRSSPSKRSPRRTGFSHWARSPAKEKLPERARSPKPVRPRSPRGASRSRSPSPRTKRLRRVQAEQEADKLVERDHLKDDRKERHDEGSHRNHREDRDVSNGRKTARERDDGGSSRSMRVHEISPEVHGHKSRYRSRSPSTSKPGGCEEATKSRDAEASRNGERDSIAKMKAAEDALENKEKQHKPSFELSGKLAEETNRVKGVTLLFTEPPDARKPDMRWRLYVFKGGEVLNEPLYVHRLSCYLFGRERRVADIPTDHPSCSKQHAVLQYRLVENEQPDGLSLKQARPYLMDLGSTNGTFINDNRIESQRYYELFEKDTIRFGNSSREYVLLHEHSTG